MSPSPRSYARRRLALLFLPLLLLVVVPSGCSKKGDSGDTQSLQVTGDKTPPPPEPSELAMGSLLAKVRITGHEARDGFEACTVKVSEVLRQGPQSRPLAEGMEITVSVAPELATPEQIAAWAGDGAEMEAVLSFHQVMDAMKGRVPEWKVTEIRRP